MANLLIILLLVQSFFLLLTFFPVLSNPDGYMLCNYNDGIRQYFFFQSYIRQDPVMGWLKVYSMGYPYGEYLFFTDSTPALAVPAKLISTYLFDISGYALYLYNLFLLFSILFSTFLLYLILKRLQLSPLLVFLFALALPWLCPEFFKAAQGHLNLSISWPLLGTIYFMMRIHASLKGEGNTTKWAGGFGLFVCVVAFIHLYWLALTTIVAGIMLIAILIRTILKKQSPGPVLRGLALGCLLPWLVAGSIIGVSDGYYDQRKPYGEGYGWHHWTLQLSGFYTAYDHNTVNFVLENKELDSYGSYTYLGNFCLYFFLALVGVNLFLKQKLRLRESFRSQAEGRFLLLLGLGAFISLMISLGESVPVFGPKVVVPNFLNLFYWIHLVTDRITQFRDVSRFSFIAFWTMNLYAVYLLQSYWRKYPHKWVFILSSILLLLLAVDTRDTLATAKLAMNRPNLLQQKSQSQIDELISKVNLREYQAVIPIPYNHEGAGDNHYVIDGFDDFLTNSLQFQTWGNIPLMSAKFSRGNFDHALQFFSLFSPDQNGGGISPTLLSTLDDRPLLVLYNEEYYNGNKTLTGNQLQPAWEVLLHCHEIIERYNMEEVAREGHFVLYKWPIDRLKVK